MRKIDLKKMALLGLASGLVVSCGEEGTSPKEMDSSSVKGAGDKLSSQAAAYSQRAADSLKDQLNGEMSKLFDSMDDAGKAMAIKVAGQSCHGNNMCKGLGSCKTDKHACAGMNDCKGQGTCAFADKNVAVRLVGKHLGLLRGDMDH